MANYTLKISPGTTLRKRITWQSASGPIDLTWMTVIAELMDQSSGLVITLTESGGGIILEPTSGVIWLYLDATSTESLSGLGTWRLLVTETNGDVRALLCGRAEYFGCSGDVQNQSVIINQDDTITVLSGEQGPAGPPGSGTVIEFAQSVAAATWSLLHNLGRYPATVSTRDPTGKVIWGEIEHVSINETRIYFGSPLTGTASIF